MHFELAATPALEEFGGPPEDSPEGSFIDLNFPAMAAKWVFDGEHSAVRFELDSPQHDDESLGNVLADLNRGGGTDHSLQAVKVAPHISYGVLFFQIRGLKTMHVEYLIESLRGVPVPGADYPCKDMDVETALQSWLLANKAAIVAKVREEAGELR